jgi:hypothetical protein
MLRLSFCLMLMAWAIPGATLEQVPLVSAPAACAKSGDVLAAMEDGFGKRVEVRCGAAGPEVWLRTAGTDRRLMGCALGGSQLAVTLGFAGTRSGEKWDGKLHWVSAANWNQSEGRRLRLLTEQAAALSYSWRLRPDVVLSSADVVSFLELPGQPLAAPVSCSLVAEDKAPTFMEQEVRKMRMDGRPVRSMVLYPLEGPVASITHEDQQQTVRLKVRASGTASIAYARDLLGGGKEAAQVKMGRNSLRANESTSPTYRVLNFEAPAGAEEIVVTESQGYPISAISGTILVGSLLLGGVLALLFRRRLPAVPEEPEA